MTDGQKLSIKVVGSDAGREFRKAHKVLMGVLEQEHNEALRLNSTRGEAEGFYPYLAPPPILVI